MAVYDPRGGGDVHIDRALTNISLGYPNEGFVGPILTPEVPVMKQSDLYYEFGKEGWVQEPGSDVRAPGSEAGEIPGLNVSTHPYFVREHSLQIAVTDEERENADPPMAPDRDGAELVTSKILLGRELAIQTMARTAANYPAAHTVTLAGTDQWSDLTNSDPKDDVKTGRLQIHSALFLEPTVAIVPYEVMAQLEDHDDMRERIKYSQPDALTADLVARLMNLPGRVVVPGVGYNSANMGQAEALAYIWGKDVVLAYVPGRPGLKIPAYAYEFVQRYGGSAQIAERWREQRRKSDVIRVSRRYDHRFIAVDGSGDTLAGYLIVDAVA